MRIAPALAFFLVVAGLGAPAAQGQPGLRERQWALAARPAVKILVRERGWYAVSRRQLLAAGLDRRARASTFRLYGDGREVALRERRGGGIEFFGRARCRPPPLGTTTAETTSPRPSGRRRVFSGPLGNTGR